jgi:voltage-dependent calcium channel alpha-2/delta-3
VTFPDHFSNGINIPDDIDSMKGKNYLKYFKDNFRIHPNWIYCRSIRKSFEELKLGYIDPDNCEMTPEEELVYYLEKFETSGAKWNKENPNKLDSNDTRCDKKLINLLLYDARVTENFPSNFNASKKNDKVKLNLDVKTSFISTHSGLLRFKIFDKSINAEKFADKRKKSIDEVWYKHAVEFNRLKPEAYVYSVAFNAFDLPQKDRRITVTRTIFLNQNKEQEKVPVAVVGYQILQKSFADYIEKYVSLLVNIQNTSYFIFIFKFL